MSTYLLQNMFEMFYLQNFLIFSLTDFIFSTGLSWMDYFMVFLLAFFWGNHVTGIMILL